METEPISQQEYEEHFCTHDEHCETCNAYHEEQYQQGPCFECHASGQIEKTEGYTDRETGMYIVEPTGEFIVCPFCGGTGYR